MYIVRPSILSIIITKPIQKTKAVNKHCTVVAVVVVRAREQIPPAMITMRKSLHGFPLLSMGMGLRLAAFSGRSSAKTVIRK